MRRVVLLLVLVAAAMALAAWLADAPGRASVEFAGWRVDTSFGVLAVAGGAFAFLAVFADRVWRWIAGAPRRFASWRRARRERHGYAALTRGLVAVAAGDPAEARRQAKLAVRKLENPPLALLLAAQAAQLAGDEGEARRQFEAMRGLPETEFVALRGLVADAMRAGDTQAALAMARRARALKPAAPWVTAALVDLETRGGDWAAAAETLAQAKRARLVPPEKADANGAAVLHERARALARAGEIRAAIAVGERAHRLGPDRPEISATLATLYARDGRARAAGSLVEKEWARRPHPDLLAAYRVARPVAAPLQWVKQVERLARAAPAHVETHLALAEACLAAELWGEAKRHAEAAIAASGGEASVAMCRLSARIMSGLGDDAAAAQAWLARAADAPADPAWTCDSCGQPHPDWQALCGHCGAFDRLEWRAPARLAPRPLALDGG